MNQAPRCCTSTTVIVATPSELRFASAEDVIVGLTRPPHGLSNEEYLDHLQNVRSIAQQLDLLLVQESDVLEARSCKIEKILESTLKDKKRVKTDQTNVMKLRDLTALSDDDRIKKTVSMLQSSIRPRLKSVLNLLKSHYSDLDQLHVEVRALRRRQEAVKTVLKWVDDEVRLNSQVIFISP